MALIVAMLAVVLFVLCAFVVDLGNARDQRRQAQNAADAAALAAANVLYASGTSDIAAATAAAKAYAASNFGVTSAQWAGCVDSAALPGSSGTPCISFNSATSPTTVRVVIPTKRVATPFAQVIGTSSVDVNGIAQATVQPGGRVECGLCVTGDGSHDIQNGNITISGASAYFNGSLDANQNGSVVVTGEGSRISIEGSVSPKGTFSPTPSTSQPHIPDPLASLTLPPRSMADLHVVSGSACLGGPGIYLDSFQFSQVSDCQLAPGLYVLAGSGQERESGQTRVTAHGVTFFFTCKNATAHTARACNSNGGSGEQGAGFLMTGNASLTVTAPTSGELQGLAILSDRNNTSTFGFRGNGSDPSTGTIYAASGTLDYRGNGSGPALDSLTVVNSLTFSGNNASFTSQYTQDNNYQLPPGKPYLSR
ncbi:pilus assembly protein TadG-related protein [Nocardioides sp. DS6]|uniref:Pilus assembly protein TadG-related protein n=1 Tax=Nocardioides eburneus TaxID=3231482 RepID=A0ABV3SXM7_9ACTN